MAMESTQVHGHALHEEHIDHQGNANLAVWLGLVALTFMSAVFVASNVYLRGWSPARFTLKDRLLTDLPYWDTVLLVVSGVLVLVAASFFARDRWRAFNGVLAIAVLSWVATTLIQFRLMIWFAGFSKQIKTIDWPTSMIVFGLTAISTILIAVAGWYASFANKSKINAFFPVAMNVWLYTVLFGIIVLLMEHVLTVGQFAAWCGLHA
jgi:heme/copper-type cytochrome/quinol oxidase subunit 3